MKVMKKKKVTLMPPPRKIYNRDLQLYVVIPSAGKYQSAW